MTHSTTQEIEANIAGLAVYLSEQNMVQLLEAALGYLQVAREGLMLDIEDHNWPAVRARVHRLKGSSVIFRCRAMDELMDKLDAHARQPLRSQEAQLIAELNAQMVLTIRVLQKHLQEKRLQKTSAEVIK